MKRAGVAHLPLHGGRAPPWLLKRMIRLSRNIGSVIIQEYGRREFLKRLADPYWFQAFSCVLGFDWHSSGTTTVTCQALKAAISPEDHGIALCGGKGRHSKKTPSEIVDVGGKLDLPTHKLDSLIYASRVTAKVDNSAIQAGYPLYHHAFVLSEEGDWVTIQQGMRMEKKLARRYHWVSTDLKSFVEEPHSAIIGDRIHSKVLDMTAKDSFDSKKVSVDIVKEGPRKVSRLLDSITPFHQKRLTEWMEENPSEVCIIKTLNMPKRMNWEALRKAYEFQPRDYEELLSLRGVGPSTVRGLALIAELVFGKPPSWRDPVKFSFAFGGKDGVPRPVDKEAMDEAIRILKVGITNARKLDSGERLKALKRLRKFVPPDYIS
ncbi:MAG: DUF763 domain-containing protein [Nitrososphaeria archaeon]|nr:DUF763 domain-containing protein [Nitrososphaeria archaeon]NIN52160.1 DUF763 domain-containing protein [Nitrososphaeria archaeon]NIQ32613.1 DUF763 domain-containing protein [Nitrososphaeria archaeon]